jgi:hypothetical protein
MSLTMYLTDELMTEERFTYIFIFKIYLLMFKSEF